jgi:hypothetical protein
MEHSLRKGDFVRVRADHPDGSRAGKDGMVMTADGEEIGLYFGLDRSNQAQGVVCSGPESWSIAELDLASAES